MLNGKDQQNQKLVLSNEFRGKKIKIKTSEKFAQEKRNIY